MENVKTYNGVKSEEVDKHSEELDWAEAKIIEEIMRRKTEKKTISLMLRKDVKQALEIVSKLLNKSRSTVVNEILSHVLIDEPFDSDALNFELYKKRLITEGLDYTVEKNKEKVRTRIKIVGEVYEYLMSAAQEFSSRSCRGRNNVIRYILRKVLLKKQHPFVEQRVDWLKAHQIIGKDEIYFWEMRVLSGWHALKISATNDGYSCESIITDRDELNDRYENIYYEIDLEFLKKEDEIRKRFFERQKAGTIDEEYEKEFNMLTDWYTKEKRKLFDKYGIEFRGVRSRDVEGVRKLVKSQNEESDNLWHEYAKRMSEIHDKFLMKQKGV